MPCHHVGNAIVCTGHRRLQRCRCGVVSRFQCDYPVGAGTCDKHLCGGCATEVAFNRHYCPKHVLVASGPEQQSLFSQPKE